MKLHVGWSALAAALLLCVSLGQSETVPCPAPFQLYSAAQLCLFIQPNQSYSWCSANRVCSELGGELINSPESIAALASVNLQTLGYSTEMWTGLNDLASEANTSRSGWQRVSGGGSFSIDDSLWHPTEPSGSPGEHCIRFLYPSGQTRIGDRTCSVSFGFVCQFVQPLSHNRVSVWKPTEFTRTRSDTYYCCDGLQPVASLQACLVRASLCGSRCRSALYNSRLAACRLLQFADAPVDPELESSPDWVKLVRS